MDKKFLKISMGILLFVFFSMCFIIYKGISGGSVNIRGAGFNVNTEGFGFNGLNSLKTPIVISDNDFDAETLSNINLETLSSKVTVLPSDSDKIKVKTLSYNKKYENRFLVSSTNGTLNVIEKNNIDSGFIFNFNSYKYAVELYLPKNYNKSFSSKLTSGDFLINIPLKLENFSLKASSENKKIIVLLRLKQLNFLWPLEI